MFSGTKGPGEAEALDGTNLRVLIVHARWNTSLITPLVEGARKKLQERGVKPPNIIIHSVPGSWELPIAVQRLYSASQVQASSAPSGDLLGGLGRSSTPVPGAGSSSKGTFDAIIAIGVLIKGDTMHFEHIAESVSRGLMRVQLDFGVPVIFGLLVCLAVFLQAPVFGIPRGWEERETRSLTMDEFDIGVQTVLNEEQARIRAGLTPDGHNHGEDWGDAAVEMGAKRKLWADGVIG